MPVIITTNVLNHGYSNDRLTYRHLNHFHFWWWLMLPMGRQCCRWLCSVGRSRTQPSGRDHSRWRTICCSEPSFSPFDSSKNLGLSGFFIGQSFFSWRSLVLNWARLSLGASCSYLIILEVPLILILLYSRCLLYCPLSSSSSSGAALLSRGPMQKSLLNILEEWWGHHHCQCHHCCWHGCGHGRSHHQMHHMGPIWDTSETLHRQHQDSQMSKTLEASQISPSEKYITKNHHHHYLHSSVSGQHLLASPWPYWLHL